MLDMILSLLVLSGKIVLIICILYTAISILDIKLKLDRTIQKLDDIDRGLSRRKPNGYLYKEDK